MILIELGRRGPFRWRAEAARRTHLIPAVDFFGTPVTRLTLGDNPFSGHSYIHHVHSGNEMMDYYTAERCVRTLFEAQEQGINTYVALGDPFTLRVIRQYRLEGGSMNILFQSYPAIDLETNLRMMMQYKPIAIYHQGGTADNYVESGQVGELRERIAKIRACGVPAGLGTHEPGTVLRAEGEGWGADFYMTCLYNARRTQRGQQRGFITGKPKELVFYPGDPPLMLEAIRKVGKPCIAFKVFAGGQVFLGKAAEQEPAMAEAALRQTYDGIKPGDLACIGVFQKHKDQLRENTAIAARILA
jgi:hypothetical protein